VRGTTQIITNTSYTAAWLVFVRRVE